MARRSDHSREQLHQMAVEAARSIIETEGLGGLSARKVAARMGYTVGTLYLVFKNLDDLIMQVNTQTLQDLYASLNTSVSTCRETDACVHALGHAYIEFATGQTQRWSALYEHSINSGIELPDQLQAQIGNMFALVERVLQPLAPHKSGQDIRVAARALWSGVHGICILAQTRKLDLAGIESVQVLADTLISNFLSGFRLQQ